ncbi:hypothetical protein Csa_016359 [Cucumis sativus]|uniref:Uncharacterized protein n=1 Tax=Cucumis sativus TaxID=3659 RepID=A0A0A0K4C3_CUCSA|nr:hypothetical protein Csa_016359 [Cucumis sativus]
MGQCGLIQIPTRKHKPKPKPKLKTQRLINRNSEMIQVTLAITKVQSFPQREAYLGIPPCEWR